MTEELAHLDHANFTSFIKATTEEELTRLHHANFTSFKTASAEEELARLDHADELQDDGGEAGEMLSQTESGTHHAMPTISSEQYNTYVRSLVKLLVGESVTTAWIKKGAYY